MIEPEQLGGIETTDTGFAGQRSKTDAIELRMARQLPRRGIQGCIDPVERDERRSRGCGYRRRRRENQRSCEGLGAKNVWQLSARRAG